MSALRGVNGLVGFRSAVLNAKLICLSALPGVNHLGVFRSDVLNANMSALCGVKGLGVFRSAVLNAFICFCLVLALNISYNQHN